MTNRLLAAFLFTAALAPAQRAPHPARALVLESIPWIDDGAEFLDQKRFKTAMTPREAAMDRNLLFDAALAQAAAENRPLLCYVYKISEASKRGRQMIRAPVLDVYMRQLIWSDPDVERIVANSFVALRTVFDEDLCTRFGVRPLTFLEPAVLFFSPAGELVHSVRTIRTFDAPWFANLLRGVLDQVGPAPDTYDLETALDRGDWAMALSLVTRRGDAPRALLERASLLRRQRRGIEALALLEQAAEAVVDRVPARGRRRRRRQPMTPEAAEMLQLSLDIDAERGAILVLMGRFDSALAPLRRVADAGAHRRRAEARYHLAMLRLRVGDEAGALRRFHKIALDDPDDLFGRRAAVNLAVGVDDGLSIGPALFGFERLTWLPEGAYTNLPTDTRWPGEPLSDAQLVEHGVAALLAQQRSHGGWTDSRYAYCPDKRITPNVWVAISALCCQALLRHRDSFDDRARIDRALQRGEDFLLDPAQLNRGRNEDVYADAYRLLYFAAACEVAQDPARQAHLRTAMQGIIDEATRRQREQGFWAHEYSNAFCTAAMVQGLCAAERVGVAVDGSVLARARLALLSARRDDGSFSYSGSAGPRQATAARQNASTRMPMCEAVLYELGSGDDAALASAFDNFWQHYDRIEGVRHTDFHSDGQIAGFMFLHSLYHTTLAIEQLPQLRAQQEHQSLLAAVREYAEIDGTFLDSEELGRSYGTAMTLLLLALNAP